MSEDQYGYGADTPGWQQQPDPGAGFPETPGQPPYVVGPGQMYPPGAYPPPPGYPGYPYHPDPGARSGAIAALITGCVGIVVCLNVLAVPTAILGGVALSRADTDPQSARKLTKWAWISLGIAAGVLVLLFVAYIVFIIVVASTAASTPS